VRPPTTELLRQSEVWYDADGERIVLAEMDDETIVALRGWLLQQAVKLQAVEVADLRRAQYYSADSDAAYAIRSITLSLIIRTHPLYWMEQRPLFQAIDRIINERRGYVYVRILKEADRS